MSLADFNEAKYKLGKLCKDRHDFNLTSQSLRYVKSNQCVECACSKSRNWGANNKEKKRIADKEYRIANQEKISERSKEKHKRSYPANREKIIARRKERRIKNKEKILQKEREYCQKNKNHITAQRKSHYIANKERIDTQRKKYRAINKEKQNLYAREYYAVNKEQMNASGREYYAANKEEYAARAKVYYQTEKGILVRRHGHVKRKAAKRSAYQIPYTSEQLKTRQSDFDKNCAYCGQSLKQGMHVDHFLPIYAGGSDALGNILPSCPTCNLSKGKSDPWAWYSRQSFYCDKRWKKILKVLGKEDYRQMPLF